MALEEIWTGLTELILPTGCAGCRESGVPLRQGVCADCVRALEALTPVPVRPTPAPAALPPCTALGAYHGVLRETLLAYKERGRHGLARPLGRLLAGAVAGAVAGPATGPTDELARGVTPVARGVGPVARGVGPVARGVGPVAVPAAGVQVVGRQAEVPAVALPPLLLIPVPATGAAVRARYGDHLRRLAGHAGVRLRQTGWSVTVHQPLRALPRPDSAGLDSAGRAAAAAAAFRLSPGRLPALRRAAEGRSVILLDDIVTTGATLDTIARLLTGAGIHVRAAALLAATARRTGQ